MLYPPNILPSFDFSQLETYFLSRSTKYKEFSRFLFHLFAKKFLFLLEYLNF